MGDQEEVEGVVMSRDNILILLLYFDGAGEVVGGERKAPRAR